MYDVCDQSQQHDTDLYMSSQLCRPLFKAQGPLWPGILGRLLQKHFYIVRIE